VSIIGNAQKLIQVGIRSPNVLLSDSLQLSRVGQLGKGGQNHQRNKQE
jgi:hypothetical protein